MPTFANLLGLRLGKLNSAVTDWKEMADKLDTLEDDARNGMLKKSDKARWKGANASVTKPFVAKTAKEFGDAAIEAKSIHGILEDAYAKLKSARDDLNAIYDKKHRGIILTPSGVVLPDPGAKGDDKATQAEVDALADKIQKILDRAQEADDTASWGLRSLIKKHPRDFSSTYYGDLKDVEKAQQAIQDRKDAKEADKLISRLDSLDDKEMARLNKLMERGQKSPEFSGELLKHLNYRGREGQEALLLLSTRLDGTEQAPASKGETRLRTLLSDNLATATRPGAPLGPSGGVNSDWTFKLLDIARNGNDLPAQHPGQIQGAPTSLTTLTDLMGDGTGKYDSRFLDSVGFTIRRYEETSEDPYPGIMDNWKGTQEDPMGGLMKAMSRSPEASTAFFDPKKSDNLDYFLKERDWPGGDVENEMPKETINTSARHYFGEALEAAATGRDPQGPFHPFPAEHSTAQADIFEKSIHYYGAQTKGDPSAMPVALQRSMADMIGDYTADVHQILGKNVDLTTEFSHLDLERDELTRVMRSASEDPKAYRGMYDAQTAYIAQGIEKYGQGEEAFTQDNPKMQSWLKQSGSVLGHMDAVRGDVIYELGVAEKDANSWNKMMQYHALGAPVTGIPLVGDTIQRLVDVGTAEYMNDLNSEVDKETRANLSDHFSNGSAQLQEMLTAQAKHELPKDKHYILDQDQGQFEGELQPLAEQWYKHGLQGGSGYMGKGH